MCTCKKLSCDSSCLCECHRLDNIDNAVNQADLQCEVQREIEEGI